MNPNIIAWAIIFLTVVVLWHGIYELLILPTLRRSIRFKLFALRDRLRDFKAEHSHQCPDEAFRLLDEALSWQTDNLPGLTFPLLHRVTELLKDNVELRSALARRLTILNSCKLHEYVDIRKEASQLTLRTIALNSGGWVIYLVPIVYPWMAWETFRKNVSRLNALPSDEVDTLKACPA
jgi:hypothetical protein